MKTVLLLRSAALGDFILSAPAFSMIRRIYSDYNIVLLTISSANKKIRSQVSIYSGGTSSFPWVDLASPHLVDQIVGIDSLSSPTSILKVRKKLSVFDIKLCIMLLDPCAPWLGKLKKLILLRFLVGFAPIYGWRGHGSIKGDRMALKEKGLLRHHVHGPLQFLSELNPAISYYDDDLEFDLRPTQESERWAENWTKDFCQDGGRLVAIAPGALQVHKQWPLESFQQLLMALLMQFNDLHFVILGTPNDKPLGQLLANLHPTRISNLAGLTTIDQSAALLKRVFLLIGNDGGAMHLGDAMGSKVISIVPGIEYPDSIEPWHNKDLVIRLPIECAPCYSFTYCPQGHQRCMRDIPVATVLSRCQSVL